MNNIETVSLFEASGNLVLSTSGLSRRPFTAESWVQIPLGLPFNKINN